MNPWRTLYRINIVLLLAAAALLAVVPHGTGSHVVTVVSFVGNLVLFAALTTGIRTGRLA